MSSEPGGSLSGDPGGRHQVPGAQVREDPHYQLVGQPVEQAATHGQSRIQTLDHIWNTEKLVNFLSYKYECKSPKYLYLLHKARLYKLHLL